MPTATYTPIDSQTLSSPAVVAFTSIPATYTDLVLIITPLSTNNRDVILRFNSDTANNYSVITLSGYGGGSPAFTSVRTSNQGFLYADYYAPSNTTLSLRQINIMNYANTAIEKTILMKSHNANVYPSGGTEMLVGSWRNTAAINRIDVTLGGDNFLAGSVFTLYGIKGA
jgi:hypothetical protein